MIKSADLKRLGMVLSAGSGKIAFTASPRHFSAAGRSPMPRGIAIDTTATG